MTTKWQQICIIWNRYQLLILKFLLRIWRTPNSILRTMLGWTQRGSVSIQLIVYTMIKNPHVKSIQWQQLRKQRKWCYHIHFFGHPGLSSNSSPFFFFFLTFCITGYLCIYQRGYLLAANLKTFSYLFKQSVKSLLMVHVIIDIPCSTGQFCGICFCFSWGEEIIFLP